MREMKDSGSKLVGCIPSNKVLLRNKYIISYTKGKNPTNTNDKGEGVPYIGASDLENTTNSYSIYTTDDLPSCDTSDVLVLWDGARAGLMGTNHKGAISSTVVKLTPDTVYADGFLYWYLRAFEKYLMDCVNGTTIPHMNNKYIEDVGFISWSINEQTEIVDFLNKKCAEIDEVIKAKEKTNELLKERRQSIIYEAVTKGLNRDVPMKDSGIDWIGSIPENWQVKKLKYCATLDAERLSENTDENFEFDYIDISSVTEYGGVEETARMKFANSPSRARMIVHDGDTIISTVRTYLKAIAYIENGNDYICSTGFCVITPNECLDNKFAYYFLQNEYFVQKIVSSSTGVSYPAIKSSDLGNIKILIPSIEEQNIIAEYVNSKCNEIDEIIKSNETSINKLKEYKDSIIYEAVTGKIEI